MRWLLLSTVISVALLGCRNNAQLDAHLELMNAERRALEDELYELEYDYEKALKKLEKAERESAKLRDQLEGSEGDFRDLGPGGSVQELPDLDLSPPTVEPGQPTGPSEREGSGLRNDQRWENSRHRVSLEPRARKRVSHLYIDPTRTGIGDFDGQPGGDGITVVIEPRDDSGRFVAQAGDVSVVLLDYAQRGAAARVARWDVDASQVKKLVSGGGRGGISLDLPWPNGPPELNRLRLDVRFTAPDGRQIEARQDVQPGTVSRDPATAEPPQERTAGHPRRGGGWTPRAAHRVQDSGSEQIREHSVGQIDGPPWTLENAAGDAIRRETIEDAEPSQRQATRPVWRPYR